MRQSPFRFLLFVLTLTFAACEKDTEGDGLTCDDLTDDVVIIDGKAFEFYAAGAYNCANTNINGATWVTHFRDMIYGSGSSLIMPVLNITLSSPPPASATTTYQLDNGMPWQLGSTVVTGKATIRVNNHEETPEVQENWFSDSESGTVDVTVAADGTITYNFSVQLVKNGGLLTDRKTVCGKNIVCRAI